MQEINFGAIASPHDYRDDYATASAVFPTVQLPLLFKSVLDAPMMQNQIPACVSHSVVDNLKLYWFKKTGKWINFSPRFLDILAKRFDGADRATGGTYPRLVFKLACQYGCATEDVLPNDTTLPVLQYRDDSLLTDAVFANAAQYKANGYIKVPIDFTTTRDYIYQFGALSTLFEIGDTLWTAADGRTSWSSADIDPLRVPAAITGGHQMTPFGWEDNQFNWLQNEWSAGWSDGGRDKYDFNAWQQNTREQWTFADITQDIKDFLKTLPSPINFHYQWNSDLHYGMNNDDIKYAQIALMILGFLPIIPAEQLGQYGLKTAAAVNKFQQANRINPPSPNNIGPLTRIALNKQFSL